MVALEGREWGGVAARNARSSLDCASNTLAWTGLVSRDRSQRGHEREKASQLKIPKMEWIPLPPTWRVGERGKSVPMNKQHLKERAQILYEYYT